MGIFVNSESGSSTDGIISEQVIDDVQWPYCASIKSINTVPVPYLRYKEDGAFGMG